MEGKAGLEELEVAKAPDQDEGGGKAGGEGGGEGMELKEEMEREDEEEVGGGKGV